MNPSDLIVICSLGLPMPYVRDLLQWYVQADPMCVQHPSLEWWYKNHAQIVIEFLDEEYNNKYRRY